MIKWAIVAMLGLLLALAPSARSAEQPLHIVAAENFYGDIARQIGGPEVTVHSILDNPEQDPHLFEASPAAGRALAGARIVIYSGVGYDPWMTKLLAATRAPNRKVIVVADLLGYKIGDNPHVWYSLAAVKALAIALTSTLSAEDPDHAQGYRHRLAQFVTSLAPLAAQITALRRRYAGTPVTATEPVFGYMFRALGMNVVNRRFQLAVMNGTEPGARDIAAFETDLRERRVKLLVFNSQATDPIAERMVAIAKSAGVPVVGATETEPPGETYQSWMMMELAAVAEALDRTPR